jgi:hypothetical protein
MTWAIISFGIGLFLLFISFFLKKILVYAACLMAMFGAVFSLNGQPWLQGCAAVLIVYCSIKILTGFLSEGSYD